MTGDDDYDVSFLDDGIDLVEARILDEVMEARVEAADIARAALREAGIPIGVDQLLGLEDDDLEAALAWAETPAAGRGPMPAAVAIARASEPGVRRCRGCGCTGDFACESGCAWAAADLCPACTGGGVR